MTTLVFINAKLSDLIEQGSQGGPSFMTTIMSLSGGGEKRNIEWEFPRIVWDISYGVDGPDALNEVKDFYMVMFGRAYGFRFKDWSDFVIGNVNTGTPQSIATGDGIATTFQTYRTYTVTGVDGSTLYTVRRKVTRLVKGTTKVYINHVLKTETTDYTVNYDTGVITPNTLVGNGIDVSVYSEFDIPVRFDTDVMKLNMIWAGAGSIPPINVIELRE